jgi:hypothetical protein
MRDLQADLEELNSFSYQLPDNFKFVDTASAIEWLERAIKAEEIVKKYATAARVIALYLKEFCDTTLTYDEMIAEASRRADSQLSALREENDIQRQSIQNLSEQVAKMQKVVDAAKLIKCGMMCNYQTCSEKRCQWYGDDDCNCWRMFQFLEEQEVK